MNVAIQILNNRVGSTSHAGGKCKA